MHIEFVTETFPPEVNGVAMTVGRLVEGLRQRGHDVHVLHAGRMPGGAGESCLPGLPLPGYEGLRFGLPAGGRLRQRWRQKRPDLVHVVTEGPLGWSAVAAARRLAIPVTSGFHTNFDRYSVHYGLGWLRPVVAAYLRSLHRRTAATMVPTEALAADLAGAGIPAVQVVGRGVDVDLFDPARRSRSLRQCWLAHADARHGNLVCLYVGRLAPEKNLQLVQRSFAAISAIRPDARMVWVGDGPSRRVLEASYPGHVFAGTQTGIALAEHYASADLFLFPSLTETYGNVVAEAMASGLPVVAYRSAAAAELIHDQVNGRLVCPGDETDFIQAACGLADQPALLSSLGRQARSSVLPRTWARVTDGFERMAGLAVSQTRSSAGGGVR